MLRRVLSMIIALVLLFGSCLCLYAQSAADAGDAVAVIDRRVNFVGMSIWWYDQRTLGEGVGGGETAIGYQTRIAEKFRFIAVSNYCYNGYSLGATDRADTHSIMACKASGWKGSRGDIWTLDTITNDFKRNIPIGTIGDYENASGVTTYYGALRAFRDRVALLSGDQAIVICANALQRNNDGYTSTSQNLQGHTLTDYETALLQVARMNGWYYIDQYRLSGVTNENLNVTTLDGMHLNNYGYALAAEPWIEQFAALARMLDAGEEDACILGDADGDGSVTILDVTTIQRFMVDIPVSDPARTADCGDITRSGLDIIDATLIQRYLAGVKVLYEIGQPIPRSAD